VSEPGSAPSSASDRTASPAGGAELSSGGLVALLALVTGVQALATFAVLALPTLATKAAPAFGFGAETAGYQIGVVYSGAAALSDFAGLVVRRLGAVRVSVGALILAASGLVCLAMGRLGLAVLGSLLIGAAYGLTNPAASHLLFRFAPRHRQNLIFALKQTGVPLGGVLAAMLLPALTTRLGWQDAMLMGAALPILLAVPLWLVGARLDDDRDPKAQRSMGALAGVRTVVGNGRLRGLATMGCTYAILQFCLFAFLITMLVEDFGWNLVAAGGMATLMQVGGVLGRIGWSLLADRIGHAARILVGIGVLSALCALLLAVASPAWPVAMLTTLLFVFGFSIVGWNGLWMAEIARTSAPGEVGLATGGVLMFTYAGLALGPAAFATVYKLNGSYGITFALFATFAIIGASALAIATRGRRGHR
jgi:predicted MFS family arabinose efflux permease